MEPNTSAGQRLEILHDHYKETFALVRDRERSRDRLFLVVIGLCGLLALQIAYPVEFFGHVSVGICAGN